MYIIDIKSMMLPKLEAGKQLADELRKAKSSHKVVKILHGYGSTGPGGAIKALTHKSLRNKMKTQEIKAYIPGESIARPAGFDEMISTYKHLISHDLDFKKDNYGITYVIF
jgi:hypothetical protein